MGALIQTKGTQHLMAYYNQQFDKQSIQNFRNAMALTEFAKADINKPRILEICDTFNLYPNTVGGHTNLLKRWKYYLGTLLGNDLNEKLRAAIYDALSSTNASGDYIFTQIYFDCVEGASKDILQSDEFRTKKGGTDDSALDKGSLYKKIVLLTNSMGTNDGASRDDQGFAWPPSRADL